MFENGSGTGALLGGLVRNHAIAEHNGRVAARAQSRVAELEGLVEHLRLKLAIEEAHAIGMRAIVDAFKRAHPSSPLLAPVGRLKDGRPKTRATVTYIAAFDKAALERHLAHPETHRVS